MEKQSFNLNADFFGGYTGIFIKILLAVVLVYVFILILNFFRDKYLTKEHVSKDPQIIDLLNILSKLCYLSGFGFILANIIQVLLNEAMDYGNRMQLRGEWDYLAFGVILVFVGAGFKSAKKAVIKEHQDRSDH